MTDAIMRAVAAHGPSGSYARWLRRISPADRAKGITPISSLAFGIADGVMHA